MKVTAQTREQAAVAHSTDSLAWTAFRHAYAGASERRRQHGGVGQSASRAAELVAAHLNGASEERLGPGRPTGGDRGLSTKAGAAGGRAVTLASRLLAALLTEPDGVAGCLRRASRWGGFDWFRNRLMEHHGFTRAAAWQLALALRRQGLITSEPNRPYLDSRGLEVVRSMLRVNAFRAHSARDWEALVMLEAEMRFGTPDHPAKLDAELVSVACGELAQGNG